MKMGMIIITAKMGLAAPKTLGVPSCGVATGSWLPSCRSAWRCWRAPAPRPRRSASGSSGSGGDTIVAVGAENEYADVIGQVGGKYVQVSAIMSNPNTDPHTFEASASVARVVSAAQLVVQNGVGYDTFMNTIENAAPSSSRKVIVVQDLLGLPTDTPNPHSVVQAGHHAGRRERGGR